MLLITVNCLSFLHSESDPHAQLDDADAEPVIDEHQEQEDHINSEQDDGEKHGAESDEVPTSCDPEPEEPQQKSTPQSSHSGSCNQELGIEPSQPKLHKFPINTNFSSKKTRSFNANWFNRFNWLE